MAETSVTLRSWGRLMHEGTRCGDLYWDLADAPGPLSYEWRIDADAGGAATLTFSGLSTLLTEAPFARAG